MGTTINAANISIGLDVKKLQEGGGFARGEIGKISQMVRQSVSPVDQYNQKLNLLEKALAKGGISSQRFSEAQALLKRQLDQANESLRRQNELISKTENKNSTIASAAMGFLPAIGIAGIVKESLKLSSTVESASAAFEVLTGSASKATEIVGQMKKLDASSPLNFLDIQQAGKALLGYGASADSVLPRLKQLGEIAMGDGERFKSLSLAFGQVTAAGRLTGQEVLQMVNNGFNPLQEISRNTGRSMIELKKEMEAGAISVKMVEDALTSATSAGGRFYGMNERLANTTAGAYAKMISDLQALGVELGDNLVPLAKELASTMREIAQSESVGEGNTWISTWADGARGLLAYVKDFGAGVISGNALNDFKNINAVLDSITAKQDELNKQKVLAEIESEKAVTQEIANNEILAGIKDRIVATSGIIAAVADKQTAGIQRQIELARIQFDEFVEAETKRQKLIEQTKKANEEAAKRIIQDTATPLESLLKKVAEIEKLRKSGDLTDDQANRGLGKAAKEFQKERDLTTSLPAAIEAGSQEAYKFMVDDQNDRANEQLKKMDEQNIIAAALLTVQEEAKRLLEKINEAKVRIKR